MSSRQVRKLAAKAQQSKPEPGQELEGEVAEDDETGMQNRPLGPRSVFADLAEKSDEEDSDDGAVAQLPNDVGARSSSTAPTTASSTSASKKGKRKKKKNLKSPKEEDDDDLDSLLRDSSQAYSSATLQQHHASNLAFQPSHLNPDEEIRRKLGVNVPTLNKRLSNNKKLVLCTPDADWPNPPSFASGAGAHMITLPNGYFTFEASSGYVAAQAHFQAMVETYDPQMIAHMLEQYPFHVDALLQMYDILVSSQQNEAALNCLRRALYALESWTSPNFKKSIGSGLSLLAPFAVKPEVLRDDFGADAGLNGALIRALTLAMRLAGRRDCFDAALALNKFILSLDPLSDPSLACLCVDYYAIKAGQALWLVDARKISNWDPAILPNAGYAKALALFILKRQESATSALELSIRRWPNFIRALLPEDDLGGAANRSWLEANQLKDSVLDRLCRLAAARQQNLWKDPGRKAWLVIVLNRVTSANSRVLRDYPQHARAVQEFYSQGIMTDFSDVVAIVPRDEPDDAMNNALGADLRHGFVGHDERVDDNEGMVQGLIDYLTGMLSWGASGNAHAAAQEAEAADENDDAFGLDANESGEDAD